MPADLREACEALLAAWDKATILDLAEFPEIMKRLRLALASQRKRDEETAELLERLATIIRNMDPHIYGEMDASKEARARAKELRDELD